MKGLDKDKIKTEEIAKAKQEYKYDMSIKYNPGHQLWEVDTQTLEVVLAEIVVKHHYTLNDTVMTERRVNRRKGCVYIQALNKKNALKKYKRGW